MDEFDLNFEKAKVTLKQKIGLKNLYMKLYSFSTENINGYIDYFDLKNKSLLTIGSSGDQILNSYLNGCRDITLIDINPFAKYYINIKIAGIISLSYQEFQDFFFKKIGTEYNTNRYNKELFNKLSNNLKVLDYNSYMFFEYIFGNYKIQNISDYLMNDDMDEYNVIIKINKYLQNEENYNKLKMILKDIKFNYINQDIFKYQSDTKYDNIFLSNLCTTDGINLYIFRDFLIKLKDNNLNVNGSMLIAYLWQMNYSSDKVNFDWKQAYNMPATRLLLKDFITEYHEINGISDILYDKNDNSDLVLIYKKK